MKLRFVGDLSGLEAGIDILKTETGFEVSGDGIPVTLEHSDKNIEVIKDGQQCVIKYQRKIHFFRGLGLLVEALRKQSQFKIYEEPQFTMNGAMFDMSRNAVFKTESVKKIIRKMALMGLNVLMLYTEDTYTVADEPYFGYMRGRYSHDELKECDDYADNFGIEMIPCIQTLAHMEQFLKWEVAKELKDTRDVFLVGNEKVYQLLEKMIVAASAPFRSKRIHLGMDEAHGMGRGKYLTLNGYQNRFEIIHSHLERVLAITAKYDLKPMIWSDMYFRVGNPAGEYYDPETVIPDEVKKKFPENLQLVYWDYYHNDEASYSLFIKKHQEFGSNPVFAGAVWTWQGIGSPYGKTFVTTNASLTACKTLGIKEVFATMWGDDGTENNYFSGLLGLQLFAEHGYHKVLDEEKLKDRFEFCAGADFEAFMDLKYLDETPGVTPDNTGNFDPANPSKFLLWQDILMGLMDKHIEGLDMAGHYRMLEEKFKTHRLRNKEWDFVLETPEKLCAALRIKCDLGIRIKKAYDEKDLKTLKDIAGKELPELTKRVEALRVAHRAEWFKIYKPFGWEILDLRYGGILARIDSAVQRLDDFLDKRIEKVEELEQERLYFDGVPKPDSDSGLGHYTQFHRIVSANSFYHALQL